MAYNECFPTRTMFSINSEFGRKGIIYSDEGKPCQSPGRMKNSSYYILHQLGFKLTTSRTVASNMARCHTPLPTRPRRRFSTHYTLSFKILHFLPKFLTLRGRPELPSFSRAFTEYTGRKGVKGCCTLFKNIVYGALQFCPTPHKMYIRLLHKLVMSVHH